MALRTLVVLEIVMVMLMFFVVPIHNHPHQYHTFEQLLKQRNYDRRMRPFQEETNKTEPTYIKTQIFIRRIYAMNEHDFTFKISYYLRHWWTDPRLSSNESSPREEIIYHNNPEDIIWCPNLTLLNSDDNHRVNEHVAAHIDTEGNVFLSQRMKATCTCLMNLTSYPMDVQNCPFQLQSYAYTMNEVRLEWHADPYEMDENINMCGYHLMNIQHNKTQNIYIFHNNSHHKVSVFVLFISLGACSKKFYHHEPQMFLTYSD